MRVSKNGNCVATKKKIELASELSNPQFVFGATKKNSSRISFRLRQVVFFFSLKTVIMDYLRNKTRLHFIFFFLFGRAVGVEWW